MQTGAMEISVYDYPLEGPGQPPVWEDLAEIQPEGTIQGIQTAKWSGTELHKGHVTEQGNAEQLKRSFDSGFATGRDAGLREGRAAAESELAEQRISAEQERVRQVATFVEGFHGERERYLQDVEHEVVELALSIAARILRREAQMDPLLLTGAVRVALGQLSDSTEVKLRVPESDLLLWQEAIAHLPNLAVRPEVVAGQEMRLGECVLEARQGSVDLGVRAQLGEIERGFFDGAGRTSRDRTAERAANSVAALVEPLEDLHAGTAR